MANQNLKGLAWGHRRATGPLEPLSAAFRRDHPDVSVEWSVRPLSDFEHQPIASIADRFDLMIIDHPFCGDIAASGACLPLEEAIPELSPDADRLYVGPSLASYRFAGHVWAAPIDAATPHAAFRADLLAKAGELPQPHGMACTLPGGMSAISGAAAIIPSKASATRRDRPCERG